jgi:hypothetical protein
MANTIMDLGLQDRKLITSPLLRLVDTTGRAYISPDLAGKDVLIVALLRDREDRKYELKAKEKPKIDLELILKNEIAIKLEDLKDHPRKGVWEEVWKREGLIEDESELKRYDEIFKEVTDQIIINLWRDDLKIFMDIDHFNSYLASLYNALEPKEKSLPLRNRRRQMISLAFSIIKDTVIGDPNEFVGDKVYRRIKEEMEKPEAKRQLSDALHKGKWGSITKADFRLWKDAVNTANEMIRESIIVTIDSTYWDCLKENLANHLLEHSEKEKERDRGLFIIKNIIDWLQPKVKEGQTEWKRYKEFKIPRE